GPKAPALPITGPRRRSVAPTTLRQCVSRADRVALRRTPFCSNASRYNKKEEALMPPPLFSLHFCSQIYK
ncbi:MAG: hypothetical protein RR259_05870, partial [Odoribacter sp.]